MADEQKAAETAQEPSALEAFDAWFSAYCCNSAISQDTARYNRIRETAESIRRELSGAMNGNS